MLDIIFYLFF